MANTNSWNDQQLSTINKQQGSLLTEVLIAITIISYIYIGQIILVTTLSNNFDVTIQMRMEQLGLWREEKQTE